MAEIVSIDWINVGTWIVAILALLTTIYFGMKSLLKEALKDRLLEQGNFDALKTRVAVLETKMASVENDLKEDMKIEFEEVKKLIEKLDCRLYEQVAHGKI